MKQNAAHVPPGLLMGLFLVTTFILLWTIQFAFTMMQMYCPGVSDAISTWTPLILCLVAVLIGFGFAGNVIKRGAGGCLVPYLLTLLLWCVYFFLCFTQQAKYQSFVCDILDYDHMLPPTQGTQLLYGLFEPLFSLDTAVYLGIATLAGLAFVCISKIIKHVRGQVKQ